MARMLPFLPSNWALLLLAASGVQGGSDDPTVAVLAVHNPGELSGNYAGYFATFSAWPLPKGDLIVKAPEDELGCAEYSPDFAAPASIAPLGSASPGMVAVVRRGNCTFLQKAAMAQRAGAKGLVVVSDSELVQIMGIGNLTTPEDPEVGIFVLGVNRHLGELLRNASLAAESHGFEPPAMSVTPYTSSLLNISEGVLIVMAASLVALGAFFSTADLDIHPPGSFSTALAAPEEEVLEVDQWLAVGFCAMGSGFLVVLFFFMQYMIYVIIFCFCCGGASCITQFGAICLNHLFPVLRNKSVNAPVIGPMSHADIIAGVPAFILVSCWVILRNTPYGWPFQDIIGAGFLCGMQRTLRLPNIKMATLFLCVMFFFDIFWVFISPLFFHESVMVRVATGGGTGEAVPMLLRVPAFGDPFGNDRLLGFGDIALPGLLVSYLRRHDLISRRTLSQGYFLPALVGYFVGLNFTIAALCIMRMGQPALLYLVPCTLGTTLVLASRRGEAQLLWDGLPAKEGLIANGDHEDGPSHNKALVDSGFGHPPL
mmetsp:Transcript_135520/g.433511  ORF Transcript_135520/g.433511 Transcript_135520/m.433511 type:complete len:541 (-) Transcript_135520:113-1735(-)